jgi:hypothetical protein
MTIPAIKVESLKEAEEIVKDIDVIAIDEGQFFVDVSE